MTAPSIVKPAKFKLDLKKQETTSPCDGKEDSREGTDHDYVEKTLKKEWTSS